VEGGEEGAALLSTPQGVSRLLRFPLSLCLASALNSDQKRGIQEKQGGRVWGGMIEDGFWLVVGGLVCLCVVWWMGWSGVAETEADGKAEDEAAPPHTPPE
jgi:hypothetical protein